MAITNIFKSSALDSGDLANSQKESSPKGVINLQSMQDIDSPRKVFNLQKQEIGQEFIEITEPEEE